MSIFFKNPLLKGYIFGNFHFKLSDIQRERVQQLKHEILLVIFSVSGDNFSFQDKDPKGPIYSSKRIWTRTLGFTCDTGICENKGSA
jgi:hypothetical protein